MLQNHPIGIDGVNVQNNSSQDHGALLRVAASSNPLRAGLVQRVGEYSHWDAAWV